MKEKAGERNVVDLYTPEVFRALARRQQKRVERNEKRKRKREKDAYLKAHDIDFHHPIPKSRGGVCTMPVNRTTHKQIHAVGLNMTNLEWHHFVDMLNKRRRGKNIWTWQEIMKRRRMLIERSHQHPATYFNGTINRSNWPDRFVRHWDNLFEDLSLAAVHEFIDIFTLVPLENNKGEIWTLEKVSALRTSLRIKYERCTAEQLALVA